MKPFYQQPLPVTEYDDRPESVRRAEVYRELEWVRLQRGYVFGWTARTYKQMFGAWPETFMQTLLPMPASPVIEKWVRSKNNAYKKEMNGKAGTSNDRQAQKAVLKLFRRGKANGNAGGALLRGDEKAARSRGRFGGNGEVEG